MPTDIYHNDQVYNMVAEGEVAQLLAHFSNSYILDVITSNIQNRFAYNTSVSNPNIVASFEMNFKDILASYPSDADNIVEIRQETYLRVINDICNGFGGIAYVGENIDCYSIAYNLYDLFVCNYSKNIINFFINYILSNMNELYDNIGLEKYKKEKDSTSNYVKRIYDDQILATIISRIKDVIYYISGFDIGLVVFMSYCNYNTTFINFIMDNIVETDYIFKREFLHILDNPALITDIRISIQNRVAMEREIPNQNFVSNNNEDEGEHNNGDNEYRE